MTNDSFMISIIFFLLSFILIWKFADLFVDASSALAIKTNVSPMIIGATIVAFGTSAPELFVNIFAALDNQADVVYGNIIGSNIANTLLILGSASLLTPIFVRRVSFEQLIPNVFFTLFIFMILLNQWVSRFTALFSLLLFFVFYIFMITRSNSPQSDDYKNGRSYFKLGGFFIFSLVGLIFSAKLLVYSLLETAAILGLSTVFLSLFAIALGTSLPELISTILFVRKGQTEMVIGNIFGSNLFNLMFVLPISWFFSPLELPGELQVHFLFLLLLLFFLLIIFFLFKRLNYVFGFFLLALYLGFNAFLFFN